jgi:hypothetical protein
MSHFMKISGLAGLAKPRGPWSALLPTIQRSARNNKTPPMIAAGWLSLITVRRLIKLPTVASGLKKGLLR